jgi:hypothetical protein
MADISKDFISYDFKSVLDKIGGAELFEMFLPHHLLEEAMRETLDEMERLIKMKFTTNQSTWKALRPATIKERIAGGFGPGPKLVRSGTLRDNIAKGHEVQFIGDTVLGGVYPQGDAKAPYGSGESIDDYAEALNEVRPFMDLTAEDEKHLAAFYEQALANKLGLTS